MSNVLDKLSRLVTARPWLTLLVLLIVTVVLAMGTTQRLPPTEGASVAFLPPGHPIGTATQEIDEKFGESGAIVGVTLIFRGEALTPDGLSQMDGLLDEIVQTSGVVEFLAPVLPVVAPSYSIASALQVDDFELVTQEQIDSARDIPQVQEALAALTGTDSDGSPVAIAHIRLNDTGDETVLLAERSINELATENEGALCA